MTESAVSQREISSTGLVPKKHYKTLTGEKNSASLFQLADQLYPYVRLRKKVKSYLYKVSEYKDLSYKTWEERLTYATACDAVLRDVLRKPSLEQFANILDLDEIGQESAKIVETAESTKKGVVCVGFHGGFVTFVRKFASNLPNGTLTILGPNEGALLDKNQRISAAENPEVALFAALRSLQGGSNVFVAPDGPFGKKKSNIDVLGVRKSVADSAAFLAHQTGAHIVFIRFKFSGQKFSPLVAWGPQKADGEDFTSFNQRYLAFYQACIFSFMTGSPRNLSLSQMWHRDLRVAATGHHSKEK